MGKTRGLRIIPRRLFRGNAGTPCGHSTWQVQIELRPASPPRHLAPAGRRGSLNGGGRGRLNGEDARSSPHPPPAIPRECRDALRSLDVAGADRITARIAPAASGTRGPAGNSRGARAPMLAPPRAALLPSLLALCLGSVQSEPRALQPARSRSRR